MAFFSITSNTRRCSARAATRSGTLAGGFAEHPAFPLGLHEQVEQVLQGIVGRLELVDVAAWRRSACGPGRKFFSRPSPARSFLLLFQQTNDVVVGGDVHDRLDRGQLGALAVDFQANLLAEAGGVFAQLIEGLADLLDRLFAAARRDESRSA